jgi:hypothetical protein
MLLEALIIYSSPEIRSFKNYSMVELLESQGFSLMIPGYILSNRLLVPPPKTWIGISLSQNNQFQFSKENYS